MNNEAFNRAQRAYDNQLPWDDEDEDFIDPKPEHFDDAWRELMAEFDGAFGEFMSNGYGAEFNKLLLDVAEMSMKEFRAKQAEIVARVDGFEDEFFAAVRHLEVKAEEIANR